MLSLEDYIAKRKKEDGINEFEIDSKIQNMQICVNYVFEYFNQYLDASKMERKIIDGKPYRIANLPLARVTESHSTRRMLEMNRRILQDR